jgi:hypothetical protein
MNEDPHNLRNSGSLRGAKAVGEAFVETVVKAAVEGLVEAAVEGFGTLLIGNDELLFATFLFCVEGRIIF